jgi:hypothetical protein
MSACQIQRSLGIRTYKTAWYLCHRIRAAMKEVHESKLGGTVEIDETYVWLPTFSAIMSRIVSALRSAA